MFAKWKNKVRMRDLCGKVTDGIGCVPSPKRGDTLVLNRPAKAVSNALVRFREPAALQHLILVLDQKLDALDWSSGSFGDSS
jgi:hypothetical protein